MATLNITSVDVAELTIDHLNLPTMGMLPELLVMVVLLLLVSIGLQLHAQCSRSRSPPTAQLLSADGL